jgi:hypothetical protein
MVSDSVWAVKDKRHAVEKVLRGIIDERGRGFGSGVGRINSGGDEEEEK